MASTADSVDVLISVHPKHANNIINGSKRAEFRKRSPRRDAAFLIVYATSPIKRVVGFARITGIVEGTLEALWSQFGSLGGITRAEFDEYFAGEQEGSVILLAEAKSLREPVETNSLTGGATPPQSFKYVPADVLKWLSARC